MSQLECRPLGLQVTRWWCARMNRRSRSHSCAVRYWAGRSAPLRAKSCSAGFFHRRPSRQSLHTWNNIDTHTHAGPIPGTSWAEWIVPKPLPLFIYLVGTALSLHRPGCITAPRATTAQIRVKKTRQLRSRTAPLISAIFYPSPSCHQFLKLSHTIHARIERPC